MRGGGVNAYYTRIQENHSIFKIFPGEHAPGPPISARLTACGRCRRAADTRSTYGSSILPPPPP